jgi:HTH-type transcriptional regulator / antitoxin HipB
MGHSIRTPGQLSSALKSARQQRRLSQGDVGGKVGLRQKTVSLIETDSARSSIGSLFRVLSALDLELVVQARRKVGPASGTEW